MGKIIRKEEGLGLEKGSMVNKPSS